MKKSNLWWCVVLAMVLAGCPTDDAEGEGADAVEKTIKITGITVSDIKETAQIAVFSVGLSNREYAAIGSAAIADQTLLVALYDWPSEGGQSESRWTGSGEWYVCLRLFDADGEGYADYLLKDEQKCAIQEAVTPLDFGDFEPDVGDGSSLTVLFHADGGIPATQTRTVPNGWVALPEEPVRADFTFGGWYTLTDGGGTQFTESTIVTAALTVVYAKWTVNQYTVTFDADGGIPATQTRTVASGGSVGALPEGPTNAGYPFLGWYTLTDGGRTPFTGSTPVNADLTVYAKWVITTVAELKTFLDDPPQGPISVKMKVNLANAIDGWSKILQAIKDKGKYVDLDVTECEWETEFDPRTYNTGEPFITGLALPNAAERIKEGGYFSDTFLYFTTTFRYFTSLKTLSAAGVETVGEYAFRNCTSLVTVSLPEATSIDNKAFYGCNGLTEVSLPKATNIGAYAFRDCTSLTEVSLPAATNIGACAFQDCTSLTEVSLPAVTSIDNNAFYYCYSLTTVSLPATPPTIPKGDSINGIFHTTAGGSSPKITVAVPDAAAVDAYTTAWGVDAETVVMGNEGVYGSIHNAVTIKAAQ